MTRLPPSPFTDSGEPPACTPDDAAASLPQMPSAGAAADLSEARFILDEQAFMDAIDEPPLFLRQVG